ncbi:hypothetical protein U9M48_034651 [Paspalum notatum var. saurae]|uniref:Gag-pol polyprotein n=1 Tax=Paspalum notatum var. saurae TaxID=547442 RepID=A0AAQ3U9J7_PASNO
MLPESSVSTEKTGGQHQNKGKGGTQPEGRDTTTKLTSEGTPRRKGKCRNCGIRGHWAKECKKPRHERKDEAHLAKADIEQPELLLATVSADTRTTSQVVHLNEKGVFLEDGAEDAWYLDTGASNHMTGMRSALTSLDETVKGRCLEEAGCKVVLENGQLCVFDRERALLVKAPRTTNRVYIAKMELVHPICLMAKTDDAAWLWHARYGHLNFRALRDLGVKKMAEGMPVIDRMEQVCDGCALGKHLRAPFPRAAAYRAEKGLELVHGDLCGQIEPPTPGGKRYFLLIVDDFSRYMWSELLVTKDEALHYFKLIKAQAETEQGGKLKAVRTDRGGEFNSNLFSAYLGELGIKHFTAAPYTTAKWCVKTAVYVLNRSPTRSLEGKTPYEAWFGKKPSVAHLRTFGCVAYAKKLGPGVNKLSDRSVQGVFLGYEPGAKAYRILDPVGEKLIISRDVKFDEKRYWSWTQNGVSQTSSASSFSIQWSTTVQDPITEPTVQGDAVEVGSETPPSANWQPGSPVTPQGPAAGGTLAGTQWATPPIGEEADSEGARLKYRTLSDLFNSSEEVQNVEYSGLCLLAAEEPASVDQALHEKCWYEAMVAELEAIRENKTWKLTDLPVGQRAIGLKWVFKVKKDPSGKIVKHKARLVAKGYAQRQGVDFDEVFAPVARLETVRLLLAIAASGGWEVHHMDVKSAFLNGDLQEEVFVHQPPGFVDEQQPRKVLKLKKALYGLRQAPRAWYARLDQELNALGFRRSTLEHAVYRRGVDHPAQGRVQLSALQRPHGVPEQHFNTFALLCCWELWKRRNRVAFDGAASSMREFAGKIRVEAAQWSHRFKVADRWGHKSNKIQVGILSPPGDHKKKKFKIQMMQSFKMSDLGLLSYYLGLEVREQEGEILLCQKAYTFKILELAGMRGCNPSDTPMEQGLHLIKSDGSRSVDVSRYRSIIGSLRYTRGSLDLVGYSDSDHAGDKNDRNSTTGVAYFLGPNLITWSSQKQKALVDNNSAIELSKNPVHHERSKHIDIRFHYIRECVDEGRVEIDHVGTDRQLADILTKALGRVKMVEIRQQLNVVQVQQD